MPAAAIGPFTMRQVIGLILGGGIITLVWIFIKPYGKLRVESEMLRFTADRDDGEVHLTQIALLGESMEDPRTFGFTDNMMAKVIAEVDRGINEFERQEAIDKALGGTEHDADERSADGPEL